MTTSNKSVDAFPTFRKVPGGLRGMTRAGRTVLQRVWTLVTKVAGAPLFRRSLAVLALALIAAYVIWDIYASYTLNQELASIRQRGEPMTLAEMAPSAIPESENAAPVYQQAFTAMSFSDADTKRLHALVDRKTLFWVTDDTEDAAIVGKNTAAIDLARKASTMPSCQFPIDYGTSNSEELQFPFLPQMRNLARLMSIAAVNEATHGNVDQALTDIGVIFRMSRDVDQPKWMIQLLVSLSIERDGYFTLAEIMKRTDLQPEQLHRVNSMLPDTDWNASMANAMVGERNLGLSMFSLVRAHPEIAGPVFQDDSVHAANVMNYYRIPFGFWSPWSKMDEVYYLRYMDRMEQSTSSQSVMDNAWMEFVANRPAYAGVSDVITPVFTGAYRRACEETAYQRLAQVSVSLTGYRARTGSYPAHLSDTVNGEPLPLDPYSGKPFTYRLSGDGYLLYSVGPNGIDDGGKIGAGNATSPDDILWPGSV